MGSSTVVVAVDFTASEGRLEDFTSVAHGMTQASKAEPGTLGYEWFSSADGRHFHLLETYVDAAAVEAHFTGPVVTELVPKLVALCSIDGFAIYGDPGAKVREMAGGMGAVFFEYQMGLGR